MTTPTRTPRPRFGPPDVQGYRATRGGRWKAKEHADGVTLTDTTGRAQFADTGGRWTRVESWAAARDVVAAFG
jgi:hypothetical protein